MVAALFLAGCETFPHTTTEYERKLAQTPYVLQTKSSSWVAAPEAKVVLERSFRRTSEQRIALPNRTALRGENFILLKAHGSPAANVGRFQPLTLVRAAGGMPYPFNSFSDLTLMTRQDALGTLNWALWTNYAGMNCVLAFRRFDGANRTVPRGAHVMDMMLRNCVHGDLEEALAPIGPDQTSYAAVRQSPRNAPQMLSPLAGPLP